MLAAPSYEVNFAVIQGCYGADRAVHTSALINTGTIPHHIMPILKDCLLMVQCVMCQVQALCNHWQAVLTRTHKVLKVGV